MSDEPVRGRLQSDGREAAVEVWFVNDDGALPGGNCVGVQPGQRQFIGGGK